MLIGLDESAASVLPVGVVHQGSKDMAGSLGVRSELDAYFKLLDARPTGEGRSRHVEPDADVAADGRKVTFMRRLPPVDFVRCVDRASPELFPRACPRAFRIIVITENWSNLKLPFEVSNVTRLAGEAPPASAGPCRAAAVLPNRGRWIVWTDRQPRLVNADGLPDGGASGPAPGGFHPEITHAGAAPRRT